MRRAIIKPVMLRRDSRGFTLVEVSIVVAISALFGLMVLYGRGYSRESAEFQAVFDRIRTAVFQVKTEADATITFGSGDSYNALLPSSSLIFFGKLVEFCDGTFTCDQIRVRTLLDDQNDATPNLIDAATINPEETRFIRLDSGVTFDAITTATLNPPPGTRSFAFVRKSANGQLEHYILATGANPLLKSSYSAQTEARYRFVHPNPNLRGNLLIAQGTVRKEIVP